MWDLAILGMESYRPADLKMSEVTTPQIFRQLHCPDISRSLDYSRSPNLQSPDLQISDFLNIFHQISPNLTTSPDLQASPDIPRLSSTRYWQYRQLSRHLQIAIQQTSPNLTTSSERHFLTDTSDIFRSPGLQLSIPRIAKSQIFISPKTSPDIQQEIHGFVQEIHTFEYEVL